MNPIFNNKYLMLSLACSLIYPLIFDYIYDAPLGVLFCSITHSILVAVVLYRIISKTLLRGNKYPSMAAIFIIVNLLYLSSSSIKYFETQLYPGFIENIYTRLLLTMGGLIILFMSFELLNNFNPPYNNRFDFSLKNYNLLKLLICLLLIIIFFEIKLNFEEGYGYFYKLNVDPLEYAMERINLPFFDKVLFWISSTTGFLGGVLILLLSIYYKKYGGTTLIIVTATMFLILSIVSGSRGVIFYFFLGISFSLVRLYNVWNKALAIFILTAQLLMALGSIIVLLISGRVNLSETDVIRYHIAYRFDLTDYAATIINGNDYIRFDYPIVLDALYYATPSILLQDKYDKNEHFVVKINKNAGLDEYTDYTDTFFSIGAQVGGIIGFTAIPFLMVYCLQKFELLIYHIFGSTANFIIIILLPLCIRVETDMNTLFADWRMIPIYIILSMIIYYIFTIKKCDIKNSGYKSFFVK